MHRANKEATKEETDSETHKPEKKEEVSINIPSGCHDYLLIGGERRTKMVDSYQVSILPDCGCCHGDSILGPYGERFNLTH